MQAISVRAVRSVLCWVAPDCDWTEADPILRKRRITLAIFILSFSVCLLFRPSSPFATTVLSNLGQLCGTAIAAMWALQASRRSTPQGKRRILAAPLCLGLGIASFGIGQAIWSYYEIFLHRETPFPSWADAGFLGEYPFMLAGILLLPRRRMTGALSGRILLDSLIIIAGMFTFSWYFLLAPNLLKSAATLLEKALGVGYPFGDLVLLCCLLILGALREQPMRSAFIRPLVAGVLTIVATDTVFAYQTLHGTYVTGRLMDIGWPTGYLLVGYAALTYSRQRTPAAEPDRGKISATAESPAIWRSIAPYLLVPAAAALLVACEIAHSDPQIAVGVRVGCGTLAVLLLVRQVFAILENHRLFGLLQRAYVDLQTKNDHLAQLATIDGMTGLANHRAFQERLRQEIHRSVETGEPLAVLMIDVDRFKRVNDAFGHTTGDEVLKELAEITRQSVRSTDLIARYGGEEFAIVLAGVDVDDACRIAERIRAAIAAHRFVHGGVTVSVGVAPIPAAILDAEALVKRADHALYTAKNNGRNRVVVAEDIQTVLAAGRPSPELTARNAANLRMVSGEPDRRVRRISNRARRRSEDVDRQPGGQILAAMLALLDLRDSETEGHSQRVARFALRLADEVERQGIAPVPDQVKKELALGALLHDVGKIGVPDSILKKPAGLTIHEWEIMRKHPSQGASLLARFPIMCDALPIVRHHHERWDGTGYPDRLAGDEIPLSARIFSMADTFDAMSSDRVYRRALSFEVITAEFKRVAGTQFDPDLVAAFLAISEEEWESIRNQPAGGLGDWRLREVSESQSAA